MSRLLALTRGHPTASELQPRIPKEGIMSNLPTTTNSFGFLDPRNQKAQSLLASGAMIVAIGAFLYWALPFVLAITSGLLQLAVMGTALWIFAMLVLNKRLRWAFGFLVQRLINFFVSGIVNKDPI